MRAAAQIVSYEIPAIMAILTVIMMVGSLSMQEIVHAQEGGLIGVGNWFLFRPVTFFAFFIYFLARWPKRIELLLTSRKRNPS